MGDRLVKVGDKDVRDSDQEEAEELLRVYQENSAKTDDLRWFSFYRERTSVVPQSPKPPAKVCDLSYPSYPPSCAAF